MRTDVNVMPDMVSVKRSSPIYNAHSYLTKVPEDAITPFIENFTEPDDLVADPFAGSGMTGIAALLSGRRAVLSDISRLGQHIGQNYVRVVDEHELLLLGADIVRQCQVKYGSDYTTTCMRCGKTAEIHRVVWSEVFQCELCDAEVIFYQAVYSHGSGGKRQAPTCPNGHRFEKRHSLRLGERPVEIHLVCACSPLIIEQPVQPGDIERMAHIDRRPITSWWPDVAFDPDTEMFKRCAMEKNGRTRLSDFFSRRNMNMLACLWSAIAAISDTEYRDKLRFAFTAILGRASKRYQWGPKRPLNAQNQTYYVASVFYEWNVLDLFERKVRAVVDAMRELPRSHQVEQGRLWGKSAVVAHSIEYHLASAHRLTHLEDCSVDYVFTDPPFGSNIFYSDMNFFAEAWLNQFTDSGFEAVVHTSRRSDKTLLRYESLLAQAFCEIYRVLRPGAWASVVFSSSRGDVWRSFQRAIREAGFVLEDTQMCTLDKGQRSVKGLTSGTEHVVTLDLIISLHKSNDGQQGGTSFVRQLDDLDAVVLQVVRRWSEYSAGAAPTTSHLYLDVVKTCFRSHVSVETVSMDTVVEALNRLGCRLNSKSQNWLLPS